MIKKRRHPPFYLILLLHSVVTSSVFALETPPVVVEIPWLAAHLNDDSITIIDARTADAYQRGHIPGAVNIPVEQTFSPLEPTNRVGNLQYIRKLFSQAGIRNTATLVVYDDSAYIDAGRVFWVFEVYGHKDVHLLNGGFAGWQSKEHLPVSRHAAAVQPSNYIPAVEPQRLATLLSVQLAIDDSKKVIIDAREPAEYRGLKSKAKRFGHIPSAINIPWEQNFRQVKGVNMLKDTAALKQTYRHMAGKKIYTYCNRGRHSSLTYVILRQLGYDAAHYDGSWLEWGNDSTLPLAASVEGEHRGDSD